MADRYWVAGGNGNYNSTTNWSATSGGSSGASVPSSADNVFFNASSGVGTATINVASNCANLNLTGFTGALAFTNNLTVNGLTLNLGTGTYTVTGTGFLIFALINATYSLTSGGTIWTGNIRFGSNFQPTINLVDNFSITGTLELSSGGSSTINGNTIFVGGNLSLLSSSTIFLGTTNFVFNGTGTWSSATESAQLRNNVTINPTGTLTLGTNVAYVTGTITYLGGTVNTAGSTLTISGNTTLNTNGIIWNNLKLLGVITLGSNLTLTGTLIVNSMLSFVLGGFSLISTNANLTMSSSSTFTMPTNQTFKTLTVSGGSTINTNTLTITENLTINNIVQGTTTILYGGTGTWTASANGIIYNPLTINTGGTLTISGTVYKATGLFTYTGGTIIDTGATVVIATASTLNLSGKTWNKLLVSGIMTLTSNINATTFGTTGANATSFVLGGNTINFTNLELGNTFITTLPTNWTAQNVELVPTSTGIINSNSITITGNLTQTGNGGYSGTTTFIYGVPALSTGTWSRTGVGTLVNNLTINSAGTINFTGGIIGGGIFTYTAGTFNCQVGSTLYNSVTGTTFNGAGITWYNVVFGGVTGISSNTSVILNTQLICLGTLTIQNSQTTFSGTNGTFDTYDFVLGSDASALRTTTLVSTKTYRVRQSFTSTQATNTNRILLKSSVGGSQAIFTLDSGATINVGFVNATDINSSLGRPIYSYKGVFTNTLNWGLLPTDNTRSGRFVYA